MAKKITKVIKLQIPGGAATPTPPVGPALGQCGVNIQAFCSQFNDASKDKRGSTIPVEITVYDDRSFTFTMKTPPASELVKQAVKLAKGSKNSLTTKVGVITQAQLEEIAKIKLPDLNTTDIEAAKRIIAGTARQMGLEIKG